MKQNKKWSMRIASFCLAGACLCGGAVLAAGGDESDPLVTLSYLTQTVTPNILKQVDEQAAKRQSELLAQLNTAIADYKMAVEGGGASGGTSASYSVVTLTSGQTLAMVSFGGQDIQNIPFDQLMGEISYVAQDNFLFDRSIRENIRMGDPGATDAEVEAAARAANCHDFIMNLEQGYDTLAGDAGDRLSGGERQRITIARAMLKKASVIILDEATAFADPESEAQIQQAISRLVRGKTLIVVAHRLNTIQNADQILVIDQGRLAACGRQEELLNTCPLYRTMWEQYQSTAAFAGKEVN